MKKWHKILFLIFLVSCFVLGAVALFGQEVADIDTAYTELRLGLNPRTGDSVFFERTTIIYADGRLHIPAETIAGDSATVINFFFNRATDAARQFAQSANVVWAKPQVVGYILQANDVLSSRFDTTIIQASIDVFAGVVDSTNWDIISTQGNFTGLLTIAPSGNNMRMQIAGQTYTLLPVGDAWIRFQNFPAGSYTDLHRKTGPGKLEFRNVDQSLIIRMR